MEIIYEPLILEEWDIYFEPDFGMYIGVHDSYDPTPMHPDEPFQDSEHMVYGDTPEECIKLIKEMELEK